MLQMSICRRVHEKYMRALACYGADSDMPNVCNQTSITSLNMQAALPVAKRIHSLLGTDHKCHCHYAQTPAEQILPCWKPSSAQCFSAYKHSRQENGADGV